MKILVTGTGRSGTGYMSKLLNGGHEEVFTLHGFVPRLERDCSWLALGMDIPSDWFVVHVWRDPELTVASLAEHLFKRDSAWRRFAYERGPGPSGAGPVADAIRFYIEWWQRAEKRCHVSRRLEEVDTWFVDVFGFEPVKGVPTNVNSRPRSVERIPRETWSTVTKESGRLPTKTP